MIPTHPPLLFPLLDPTGAVYNPSIAYPYRPAIFNSLTAGLLGSLVPVGVILFCQLFFRSFADFSAANLGLAYALATGTCFQIILKKTIGGLRPHFLDVCNPKILPVGSGIGFNGIMYSRSVCRGDSSRIEWAMQSFPSGHSEITFAGLGYLAIYLFTHLRLADRSRSTKLGIWRMVVVLMPLVFATYISSTLWLSYQHHVNDCIFGAGIGILTALLGYRTAYQSLTKGTLNARPRIGRRLKKEMEMEKDKEKESTGQDGQRDVEMGRSQGPGVDGARSVGDSLRGLAWTPPFASPLRNVSHAPSLWSRHSNHSENRSVDAVRVRDLEERLSPPMNIWVKPSLRIPSHSRPGTQSTEFVSLAEGLAPRDNIYSPRRGQSRVSTLRRAPRED